MSSYETAVREALMCDGKPGDLYLEMSPMRRLSVYCRWKYGSSPDAEVIIEMLREFGMDVDTKQR